jgi:hypothetical protein
MSRTKRTRSSARFIAYDIRPSKQLERRLILDLLLVALGLGLPVPECTYVGMGGFKFFDFIMFNRYIGLKKLVSIEHDQAILERCHFNKPFEHLEVFSGELTEFIDDFSDKSPHIVWFDYDWGLTSNLGSSWNRVGELRV